MASRPLSSDEVESTTHASHAVAADTFWYVSAGQAAQLASPGPALKLPGAHAVHGPPSGPVNPALHVQFESRVLVALECEKAGQAAQSSKSS